MLAVGNNEITNVMVGSTEISNAYIGNTLVWTRDFPKPWLCFEALYTQGTSVSMTKVGSPSYTPRLEYSTNGKNWSTFTPGSTSVKIAKQGDKVWFRAPSGYSNTRMGTNNANYWKFNPNGYVSISGDVTSVLQTDGNVLTIQDYALTSLFRQNVYIRDVSGIVLPFTKAGNRACSSMFRDCTALNYAPSELYIAERMSNASAQYSYAWMFYGCGSMLNCPTLKSKGGLISSQTLYQAFCRCSNITSARVEIPYDSLTLQSLQELFAFATKLNHLELTWTGTWNNTTATMNWMSNVSSTGTCVCPAGLTISSFGTSTIPSAWTIERT